MQIKKRELTNNSDLALGSDVTVLVGRLAGVGPGVSGSDVRDDQLIAALVGAGADN